MYLGYMGVDEKLFKLDRDGTILKIPINLQPSLRYF